jgi:hypothetical protein
MSFYSLAFTVPQNTPETKPYEQPIPITPGILHQVLVSIPPGHKGLTGCAIDDGLHQVAPSNQNAWFTGDRIDFVYPEYIEIPPSTTSLGLRGYNLSDHADHTFIIGIGIMPVEVYNAILDLANMLAPIVPALTGLASFFKPPTTTGG